MTDLSALIEERQRIRAHLEAQDAQYAEYKKPYNERLAAIDAECTAYMAEQGIKSFKTDHGTAIISQIDSPKIKADERDAYLDMCLENWDTFGGEMLQIGTPKAEAVRNFMDAHGGHLPPHIELSTILRFSVRKT